MTEELRAVRARGWTAKQWTSERGKQHGGQPLSMSRLKLLLTNVLYRGDISHKGTVYPGEHEALISRELWVKVNGKLRLSRTVTRSHVKVETLLENLLACAQCGSLLRMSFTRRQGQRHKGTCTTCAGQGRSGIRLARKHRSPVSISIGRSERGWNGCGAPCPMRWRSSNFSIP